MSPEPNVISTTIGKHAVRLAGSRSGPCSIMGATDHDSGPALYDRKYGSIPVVSIGKYCEQNENLVIPIGIQVHHGLVDGIHAGDFYQHLSVMWKHLPNIWPDGFLVQHRKQKASTSFSKGHFRAYQPAYHLGGYRNHHMR